MIIRITSKKDGFRRAGRVHTGTKTYTADAFTRAELAALKNDPMLVVDELSEDSKTENPPDMAALQADLAAARKALLDAGEREKAFKADLDAARADLAAVREQWDAEKAAWQTETAVRESAAGEEGKGTAAQTAKKTGK